MHLVGGAATVARGTTAYRVPASQQPRKTFIAGGNLLKVHGKCHLRVAGRQLLRAGVTLEIRLATLGISSAGVRE